MRFGSVLRALFVLTLLAAATACGDRSPDSGPAAQTTPAEALRKARAAHEAGKPDDVRRMLEEAAKDEGETGRAALTWQFELAIRDHDAVLAADRLVALGARFGGRGKTAEGREADGSVLGGALVDEAAEEARRAVEGPTPNFEAARTALAGGKVGARFAPADRATYEAAAAYVGITDRRALRDAAAISLDPGKDAMVIVFADDFQLLEPILPSVLKRWSRGLHVAVIGILTGKVRAGIRRVPASRAEERAALEARAKELGLALEGTIVAESDAAAAIGLVTTGATVFVLDAEGKIVGRAAGSTLDPRVLDPVVTRLAPKAAPEPDPTEKPGPR